MARQGDLAMASTVAAALTVRLRRMRSARRNAMDVDEVDWFSFALLLPRGVLSPSPKREDWKRMVSGEAVSTEDRHFLGYWWIPKITIFEWDPLIDESLQHARITRLETAKPVLESRR